METGQTRRLLRTPTVEQITGLKRAEIYSRVKKGTFPTPVKLGRRSLAWVEADIQNWINNLVDGTAK